MLDQLCGWARFYSTMVSAASLKVMDFYNDKKRFKFILDVFICNLIVVVVFVHIVVALFSMLVWLDAHVVQLSFPALQLCLSSACA